MASWSIGRRSEILACNALVRAARGAEIDTGVVFVRWLFLDPQARQRIESWSDHAATALDTPTTSVDS